MDYSDVIQHTIGIGYPTEAGRKIKFRKIFFAHKLFLSCPIVMEFQNDSSVEIKVMGKCNLERFEFRRDISYCNTTLGPFIH